MEKVEKKEILKKFKTLSNGYLKPQNITKHERTGTIKGL